MAEQHIVLCGDSIFDNRSYVKHGEPDVARQVQQMLPNSKITLLAVDGHQTKNVKEQLIHMPNDVTHLFISVGGNDGLMRMNVFDQSANTVGDAMGPLYNMRNEFEIEYHKMLKQVLSYSVKTTLCSIYYPKFDGWGIDRISEYLGEKDSQVSIQEMSMVGLALYNDIITKEAFHAGLPLIDLRILCNEDDDFSNPIEPSAIGGQKIASAITKIVSSFDFSTNVSNIFC